MFICYPVIISMSLLRVLRIPFPAFILSSMNPLALSCSSPIPHHCQLICPIQFHFTIAVIVSIPFSVIPLPLSLYLPHTASLWLCMVVWCTQDLRQDGCSFMWHQPCQRCKYTTLVDIQKTRYKAIHSCRTTCERSESAQESGE